MTVGSTLPASADCCCTSRVPSRSSPASRSTTFTCCSSTA